MYLRLCFSVLLIALRSTLNNWLTGNVPKKQLMCRLTFLRMPHGWNFMDKTGEREDFLHFYHLLYPTTHTSCQHKHRNWSFNRQDGEKNYHHDSFTHTYEKTHTRFLSFHCLHTGKHQLKTRAAQMITTVIIMIRRTVIGLPKADSYFFPYAWMLSLNLYSGVFWVKRWSGCRF